MTFGHLIDDHRSSKSESQQSCRLLILWNVFEITFVVILTDTDQIAGLDRHMGVEGLEPPISSFEARCLESIWLHARATRSS